MNGEIAMKKTFTLTFCIVLLCSLFVGTHLFAAGPGPKDKILAPGRLLFLLGPYGGIDYNIHKGQFNVIEGNLVCCTFDNGTGIKPVFGVKAFIPLSEAFHISPRVSFEGRGGEFTTRETLPIFGQNNQVENMDLEEKLRVTYNTLTVDLFASYTFTSFGLYVTAGPSVGFSVSKEFRKTETILGPPGVRYLDGTTSKEFSLEVQGSVNSVLFSLRGGIGAAFPIARSVYLNPEVLYIFPLNKVSKDFDWKASGIQATLGVLFAL
jgi:hypothetical protein